MGRLRVGAAVGTGEGTEERVAALVAAGVDVITVDTAHGHSKGVLERVRWVKQNFPEVQVIGGNIATAGRRSAGRARRRRVKVGIGPGSICTTRMVAGVGVPQITAVSNVADASGGQRRRLSSPTAASAIPATFPRHSPPAPTASCSAACWPAPRKRRANRTVPGPLLQVLSRHGLLGAMQQGSSDRYFQDTEKSAEKLVPEGVEGRVPYKGSVLAVIHQLMGGLRSSAWATSVGVANHHRSHARKAEFVEITGAGIRESHVHDVQITKEAPNYHVE
jgi:IMP dehydrogenase